ncbi:MAG: cupin domain-containing protein [Planctomycetaceae bacterium]
MFTEPVLFETAHLPTPETEVAGIGYRLLISAEQTGGAYELMYFEVPPGFAGPRHMHRHEDECTMTLEGVIQGTVGEKTVRVPAGSVLHLPRDVPHACRNVGERTAKFLIWVTPGNLAGFYDACKRPRAAGGCDTGATTEDSSTDAGSQLTQLVEVAGQYGIAILPD